MDAKNITTLEELFAELNKHNAESPSIDPLLLSQLQGQAEESLGLLDDVVSELRIISPEAVNIIQCLTLQIFECDSELLDEDQYNYD
ncbi:MAG: hypothetical protein AAF383_22870 [Cyanobacteria bacterium P01_A01_bin.83]